MLENRGLVQVVLQLSRCRGLDEIVQVLRDNTRDLIGADGVTIVLRDVDQCFYAEENAIAPLWKGKRFPMSACISGWCMLNRQQVVISDIYKDARVPHDAYRPTFVKSLAMTPIRSSDPVAAIGAYWSNHHDATPEQLRTLQALGDSAAMALENSQLIDALRNANLRKDEFISMLAHELRNPLAPIRSGVHLLKLDHASSETVEEAANIMERQVAYLTRIVDDLLDVARINNGKIAVKPSRIDFGTLVRQGVEDRRDQLTKSGLSLRLEVPVAPVWIDGDATRLSQVLGNILDNARKYTPAGGAISVALSIDSAAKQAVFSVQDNGVGISSKMLPHIFESFMQADHSLDRSAGGLGLGLAVASGFVRAHGGTIQAYSDGVGRGAQLTVTLPIAEAEQCQQSPRVTATSKHKGRVLIVEDNRDSAFMLQRLLKAYGFEATVAYDGAEGVERARADRPDIILCDIGLPKMDGFAVASELRKSPELADTRMIAVTGYGSEEDRRRSREAGFSAHLLKPVDLEDLLKHLEPAAAPAAA